MRNRDKPASPATTEHTAGLSKREAAAISAMQGMLASGWLRDSITSAAEAKDDDKAAEWVANMLKMQMEMSVRCADALFDELEKGDG